jgi:hypothetical protein
MQQRFDRIYQVFLEPLDLLDDEAQRDRLARLFGVGRPGLERALADLLADVLDDVSTQLDDTRVDMVLRGENGGFAVEVKRGRPQTASTEPSDTAEFDAFADFDAFAATGEADKLTLRLPSGLKEQAADAAALEGLSLNSWIVRSVAQALGGRERRRIVREVRREERGRGGSQLRGWVGG